MADKPENKSQRQLPKQTPETPTQQRRLPTRWCRWRSLSPGESQ
jgi:hypothetical protein